MNRHRRRLRGIIRAKKMRITSCLLDSAIFGILSGLIGTKKRHSHVVLCLILFFKTYFYMGVFSARSIFDD